METKEDTRGVVKLGMPPDKKPEMSELHKHLVKYCGLWRAVGLKLGLNDDLLETISKDNSKHQECFRVMLHKWLMQDVNSTWNTLELAITNAQRDALSLENLSRMPRCVVQSTRAIEKHEQDHGNSREITHCESIGSEKATTTHIINPNKAISEFASTVSKIEKILATSNEVENLDAIKSICAFLPISNNSNRPMFTAEQLKEIDACNNIREIFRQLRFHLRWDDHLILTAILDRLDSEKYSEECEELLSQFESKVDCQIKLEQIFEECKKQKQEVPRGFDKMIAIINKKYSRVTKDEYDQLKCFIAEHCGVESYVLSPFLNMSRSSLLLEWLIPSTAITHMVETATNNKDIFIKESFVFLQIAATVILEIKSEVNICLLTPEKRQQESCIKMLVDSLEKSTLEDREATLSTLKKVFDNIFQHPNDDKYHQIKLTNQKFSSQVWRYPAAVSLMEIAGWEEDGDYVRLRDESHSQAISELLEQELQKIREPTPKGRRRHENANAGASSSSKCCVLTKEKAAEIIIAIRNGHGQLLKQLLSPYHATCVKNMQVAESVSIIACVYMTRQIGIARLLVNEYGVDFNILHEGDYPEYFMLFEGCDATESCQSLIIEFIKELKIDVHNYKPSNDVFVALHFAVLHKLFTVLKFLVEDCKVNVNCVYHRGGNATPLHMAYSIGEERIAQYLIEHGADQNALDIDGRKPIDYKFYVGSISPYARVSQFYIKKRVICKDITRLEYRNFRTKCQQGITEIEAVELTFKEFPSLQEKFDREIANQPNLEATPTQRELNQYITDMSPSYFDIGLELDIPFATLKLIRNDPNLPDLKEKCRKMLETWLENDTSATWKKLCDTLQEVGMNVLAEQIKKLL